MQFAFAVFFIVVIYTFSAFVSFIGCTNGWKDSGIAYKYTLTAGCLVSPKNDNKWIPSTNYREEE